jgi:Adenylate kinase
MLLRGVCKLWRSWDSAVRNKLLLLSAGARALATSCSTPDVPTKVFFILGNAGAGKGTQCALLAKEFGWLHLSAGELLRKSVYLGTPEGRQAQEIMSRGQIVPAHVRDQTEPQPVHQGHTEGAQP